MGLALAVGFLLAINVTAPHADVRHVAPTTLRGEGPALRLPNAMLGFAWARRGRTLAVVAKPVATGQPIHIADADTLRAIRTIPVGDRDVCGLTFDGSTLVALAADRPCYWTGGRFSLLRIDPAGRRPMQTIGVPAIHTAFPTNLAFGDGRAYVAHPGGGVDAIDLRTGVATPHWPKRMLAKGEGIVRTHWLGDHLLGVGGEVVDTRTWRARAPQPHATGFAAGPNAIIAYGPNGVGVYTRSLRLRYHTLAGQSVGDAHVAGRYLYATLTRVDATEVIDLRSGRLVRDDPTPNGLVLLAP